MNDVINMIMPAVLKFVALVIIAALGLLGNMLVAKLRQKSGLTNIALATEQIIALAQQTVDELQQTLVDGWKKSNNGKLTEAQIAELKSKVLEKTRAKAAESTIKLLEGAKCDVAALIAGAAEQYIIDNKKEKPQKEKGIEALDDLI